MRSVASAFLLGLISFVAYAQPPIEIEKPVLCSDVKTVIETMSGPEWQEVPFWVGKDTSSKYVLMVNEKTKTWTMVQYNDDVACILGTGSNSTLVNHKTTRTKSS
jgi:hypothetical protein